MDLSSIEELKHMYHYIVSIYRNLGLSQQSRQAMKSIFMTFEIYIDSTVKHMKMGLTKVSNNLNMNSFKTALNFYEIVNTHLKVIFSR